MKQAEETFFSDREFILYKYQVEENCVEINYLGNSEKMIIGNGSLIKIKCEPDCCFPFSKSGVLS